jgi:hypothetical protein
MTDLDYEVWKLEYELIDKWLRDIEAREHAILREVNCPTDPVRIYAILRGECPAPWPRRTAARAKRRATHAMFTLLHLGIVRTHITFGQENARKAAYAALQAGLLANDAVVHAAGLAAVDGGRAKGGEATGRQISAKAAKTRERIQKLHCLWLSDENLRIEFPSFNAYIQERIGMPPSTANRYVKNLPKSR